MAVDQVNIVFRTASAVPPINIGTPVDALADFRSPLLQVMCLFIDNLSYESVYSGLLAAFPR